MRFSLSEATFDSYQCQPTENSLEVPSTPGKGEKVAGGRMRGLCAGSGSIKSLTALPNEAEQQSFSLTERGCPTSNRNLDPTSGQLHQYRDT